MVHFLYCCRKKLLTFFDESILDIRLKKIIEIYYKYVPLSRSGICNRNRKRKLIISLINSYYGWQKMSLKELNYRLI